jgi:hypothetical protein
VSGERSDPVIWLSDAHPTSGHAVVLEDDGRSCWLYLRGHPEGQVAKSVIAYSPIAPVSRVEFQSKVGRGDTPILMAEFASAEAVIVERYPDDFSFEWREDGGAAALRYRDEVIAVVSIDERYGSSRAVAKSGPFGDPLHLERYPWL